MTSNEQTQADSTQRAELSRRAGTLLEGELRGAGLRIGIVAAKLNAIKMAIATDDLPQNVNFAIKGYVIASFLDANKIKTAPPQHHDKPMDNPAIAEEAQSVSAFVVCR